MKGGGAPPPKLRLCQIGFFFVIWKLSASTFFLTKQNLAENLFYCLN